MLKTHGFHGARGTADIARVAGLAEYDANMIENGTVNNWLWQFGEAPINAKIAF